MLLMGGGVNFEYFGLVCLYYALGAIGGCCCGFANGGGCLC